MTLAAGDHLGPYSIIGPLGSGGMGEVYRAHDPRLARDIALKLLPPGFAHDADRLARFQREAQVLASLNHPNIGGIHGVEDAAGVRALVLELVEGPTLADRVAQGPIPLDEALAIARQIADALEAAHEHGVIHRDLKPANIKLRPDGTVKVLDFGLAKPSESTAVASGVSMSPTVTSPAVTLAGVILGTAAYMSPEQAKGKPVDKRADVWAFGCVLYEMLTGQRPFAGDDVSDTLAFVLTKEPNWNALPAATPAGLRVVLQRCVAKDPRQRIRSAGDVRLALDGAFDAGRETDEPSQPATSQIFRHAVVLLVCAVAAATGGYFMGSPPAEPRHVQHFAIELPEDAPFHWTPGRGVPGGMALSADGQRFVYIANKGGVRVLYKRQFDQPRAELITGTENAGRPEFSPDGEWVAFFAAGKLKKVAVRGGVPTDVCDVGAGALGTLGISWRTNEQIIFSSAVLNPAGPIPQLYRVAASGGKPEPLACRRSEGCEFPHVMPDNDTILFTIGRAGSPTSSIGALSLTSGEVRVVVEHGYRPRYVSSGHLLYALADGHMAVPFDVSSVSTTGPAVSVLDNVAPDAVAIAENGMMIYASTGQLRGGRNSLVWVDRKGKVTQAPHESALYSYPRISPDGSRIAVGVDRDIWVLDVSRPARTPLTAGDRIASGETLSPVSAWTRDGKRVTFSSRQALNESSIEWINADGSGQRERLISGEFRLVQPGSWSTGGVLAFYRSPVSSKTIQDRDLEIFDPKGQPSVQPFLETRFRERAPAFSPDGRWIVFVSDVSGRDEVYLRPYPGPGAQIPVSTSGGVEPTWSRNGEELFYRSGNRMMIVPVKMSTGISLGQASVVFEGTYATDVSTTAAVPNYDVGPDGRFLMIASQAAVETPTTLSAILNWFEELKHRAPAR